MVARINGYLAVGLALPLPASRTGRCIIHKCKRNSNNTFSKGKTWNVEDIRALEVFDVSIYWHPSCRADRVAALLLTSFDPATFPCQSFHFGLTMSKPYRWETEREREQQAFVEAVAKVYNKYMRRPIPRIVGLEFRDDRSGQSSSRSCFKLEAYLTFSSRDILVIGCSSAAIARFAGRCLIDACGFHRWLLLSDLSVPSTFSRQATPNPFTFQVKRGSLSTGNVEVEPLDERARHRRSSAKVATQGQRGQRHAGQHELGRRRTKTI